MMQKAINAALAAALILVAGAVAALYLAPPQHPAPDIDTLVDAAIEARLAEIAPQPPEDPAPSQLGTADFGDAIETYLLDNPRLLERMSAALETELRAQEREQARTALASLEDEIYNDPANIVLGNPDGDVTLVELFDYNCGYCRQVVPDLLALIDQDPDLRIILKEFPILSQGSVDAARIGILVNREGADYTAFHTALFSARGAIDAEVALAAAESVGLNRVLLELDMNNDDVTAVIERSYRIAQGLGVSGTPTFIIGDEVIPGAVSKDQLERRIANMRECGHTVCS
ncbi:DsbA family protein [Pelagibacterium lentulum]|nr:DsbA family protein [Pelagibacterium lentulum]